MLWLHSSLAQTAGPVVVARVAGGVTNGRDAHGVPRIHAASDRDAAFALGFLHAQDRLFQMEMMRRYGAGRLSEVLGGSTIAIDRTMRIFGFYQLAEQQYAFLSPELRAGLD